MAPTTLIPHPRTAAPSTASTSAEPFFAPMSAVALVLLVLLSAILFGTLGIFVYRRYLCRPQAQADNTKEDGNDNVCSPLDSPALSASSSSPLVSRQDQSTERPCGPKTASWKDEEAGHEPFTDADVIKAVRSLIQDTPSTTPKVASDRSSGWTWICSLFKPSRGQRTVPEIIIHPCDNAPWFAYDEGATVPGKISSPQTPDLDFSPELSEPDSPPLETPMLSSAPHPNGPTQSLDVPLPMFVVPRGPQEDEVIEPVTPPRKPRRSRVSLCEGVGKKVGLGLGHVPAHLGSFIDFDTTPYTANPGGVFGDTDTRVAFSESMLSARSSLRSVVDIVSALGAAPETSFWPGKVEVAASTSDDSGVLTPSSKRRPRLVEAFSPPSSHSSFSSNDSGFLSFPPNSSDSLDHDVFGDDHASVGSGHSCYHDCLSDTRIAA